MTMKSLSEPHRLAFASVAGLDSIALTIIRQREQQLHALLMQDAPIESCALPGSEPSVELWQLFVERKVSLNDDAYAALAQRLGFVDGIRRLCLLRFWRHQMLNPSKWILDYKAKQSKVQIILEEIEQSFLKVLEASEHKTDWIRLLTDDRICRDKKTTQRVAEELDRVINKARGLAKNLVETWARIGPIGLLKHSDYPCFDELDLLHSYEADIIERRQDAQAIIEALRADVIALKNAFHATDVVTQYRKIHGRAAQAWDQSLLHQPVGVAGRTFAQERLKPIRSSIGSTLAALRDCSERDALVLLDAFLQSGLPGLINLRCGGATHPDASIRARNQIHAAANPLLHAISAKKRDVILARLLDLHTAAITTETPFPLNNLIRHLPSTKYRRKRQQQQISESLVTAFAANAQIESKTAWSYIKNLMVYGPLGMLPQREWSDAIDPRLWSYLHMLKLGRLDGTLSESVVTNRVNQYASSLGIEPLPKQMVIGIYRHFSKPRFYNSGDGEAITGVSLRKALKIAGVTRLHEQWLVLSFELDIDLVNTALHSLTGRCWIVLVLDCGSQRPVGFWLVETTPTSIEAGLALYDAIFHPSALHWPLRGIPENILVQQELLDGAENLKRASEHLLTNLKDADNLAKLLRTLPYAKALIADLQKEYEPAQLPGRRRAPKRQLTIHQAEEEIRAWLYKRCFPNHRTDPVPLRIRKQGVALPGEDTPAAGWLLPIVAENIQTIRGGVKMENLLYVTSIGKIEPGAAVHIRSIPQRLGQRRAVFIEFPNAPDVPLQYLSRSSSIS